MDYAPCQACRSKDVLCVTPAYCKAMRYPLGGGNFYPASQPPKRIAHRVSLYRWTVWAAVVWFLTFFIYALLRATGVIA